MSRLDLYDMIMRACPTMRYETEEERLQLVDAMVAAYNRALEDAVKIANTRQTREMILKQIEGLKVG